MAEIRCRAGASTAKSEDEPLYSAVPWVDDLLRGSSKGLARWHRGSESSRLVDVTHLLQHAHDFFRRLEHHCDAGCCGFDAFSFDAGDVQSAALDSRLPDPRNPDWLGHYLRSAADQIRTVDADITTERTFNDGLSPADFADLLQGLAAALDIGAHRSHDPD